MTESKGGLKGRFLHYTQIGKMLTQIDLSSNAYTIKQLEQPIKNCRKDVHKDTTDKSKWKSKIYSDNSKEGREKMEE